MSDLATVRENLLAVAGVTMSMLLTFAVLFWMQTHPGIGAADTPGTYGAMVGGGFRQ